MWDWDFIVGMGSLLALIGFAFMTTTKLGQELWRWLKGSQTNYHWKNGAVETSTEKLNSEVWRWSWCYPTIEFVRRPFRRLSVSLHDSRWYPLEWRIGRPAGRKHVDDTVSLTSNVLAKTAVEIFGSYQSLQAMLDRNAELERELADKNYQLTKSEGQRRWLWADREVIFQVLNEDRKKHYSKFSKGLRLFLENERSYTSAPPEVPRELLLDNCRGRLEACLQRASARPPLPD